MQAKLYRRPGSLLWWTRVPDDSGQLVEHCTGSANLDTAHAYAARFDRAPQGPPRAATHAPPAPRRGVTLDDALATFLAAARLDRAAPTLSCYEQRGGHLVRLLGDRALARLHVDDVHAYCAQRLDEGAARESVRKELCVLRCALQLARDRGVFERDPGAVIPRFRARYTPKRRWLSEEELPRLLRQLPAERQRWVLLAVFTGGRLSEIESATWADVDWRRNTIHLNGTKTARSDRFVPLHPELAELLRPHSGQPDEPIAGTWHNVRRDLAQACERAKLERVSPNDLRRTFASWLKQAGCESMAVAKLLGHTSSRMVELVYGHLDQRALEAAVVKLPRLPGAAARRTVRRARKHASVH